MAKGRRGPATTDKSSGHRFVQVSVGLAFVAMLATASLSWLVPVEVVQQWALDRAGDDSFAKFEAVGGAEFSLWVLLIISSLSLIPVGLVWWHADHFGQWCADARRGWVQASCCPGTNASPLSNRIRTAAFRAVLACWIILFLAHAVIAFGQCRREWPYFRFNSGDTVLPNISDTNRAVIRYLQQSTAPTARILVASDQKLFFLSYYLRPRVLLHRMHPESEHVIPLKDQQRKLNAYQLSDLSEADLKQMPHDFTLEYFEHPDLVDRSQVLADTNWISFLRQRERDPSLVPNYVVKLRPVGEKQP